MNKPDEDLILRQPTYVPTGWLVAIVGASGTAILLSVSLAVAWATLSNQVQANSGEVAKVQGLSERIVRIETILVYKFPREAEEADRMIATQQRGK